MEQRSELWRHRIRDRGEESSLREAVEQRIDSVLESWVDTPYFINMAMKSQGVDCIRFVCSVFNELYREERASLPHLPQDTAMHNPSGAFAVLREVLRIYPEYEIVQDIEPGDLAITAKPGCGPGHSVLAGTTHLFHAIPGGVCRTGLSIFTTHPIYRIYRPKDKMRWA